MTNPVLTFEEELDVLEAVYKIGKEKGLNLLKQDQIRKLMESGRHVGGDERGAFLDDSLGVETYRNFSKNEILEMIIDIYKTEIVHNNGEDFWNRMSDRQKLMAVNMQMYLTLGISVGKMQSRISSLLESV